MGRGLELTTLLSVLLYTSWICFHYVLHSSHACLQTTQDSELDDYFFDGSDREKFPPPAAELLEPFLVDGEETEMQEPTLVSPHCRPDTRAPQSPHGHTHNRDKAAALVSAEVQPAGILADLYVAEGQAEGIADKTISDTLRLKELICAFLKELTPMHEQQENIQPETAAQISDRQATPQQFVVNDGTNDMEKQIARRLKAKGAPPPPPYPPPREQLPQTECEPAEQTSTASQYRSSAKHGDGTALHVHTKGQSKDWHSAPPSTHPLPKSGEELKEVKVEKRSVNCPTTFNTRKQFVQEHQSVLLEGMKAFAADYATLGMSPLCKRNMKDCSPPVVKSRDEGHRSYNLQEAPASSAMQIDFDEAQRECSTLTPQVPYAAHLMEGGKELFDTTSNDMRFDGREGDDQNVPQQHCADWPRQAEIGSDTGVKQLEKRGLPLNTDTRDRSHGVVRNGYVTLELKSRRKRKNPAKRSSSLKRSESVEQERQESVANTYKDREPAEEAAAAQKPLPPHTDAELDAALKVLDTLMDSLKEEGSNLDIAATTSAKEQKPSAHGGAARPKPRIFSFSKTKPKNVQAPKDKPAPESGMQLGSPVEGKGGIFSTFRRKINKCPVEKGGGSAVVNTNTSNGAKRSKGKKSTKVHFSPEIVDFDEEAANAFGEQAIKDTLRGEHTLVRHVASVVSAPVELRGKSPQTATTSASDDDAEQEDAETGELKRNIGFGRRALTPAAAVLVHQSKEPETGKTKHADVSSAVSFSSVEAEDDLSDFASANATPSFSDYSSEVAMDRQSSGNRTSNGSADSDIPEYPLNKSKKTSLWKKLFRKKRRSSPGSSTSNPFLEDGDEADRDS